MADMKPNGPCPKCGNKSWDGPRYDSFCDRLIYRCTDCRFDRAVLPLDRTIADLPEPPKAWGGLNGR